MILFADLQFFLILLIVLLPAVVLGLLGKSLRLYTFIALVIMLSLIFAGSSQQALFLALYVAWQWSIIKGYSVVRQQNNSLLLYRLALLGSLLPLVTAKLSPFLGHSPFGFLGISYVTFKCLQMVIEIRDGLIFQPLFRDFLAFLLFFPTLSSGPIDRYRRFTKDFYITPGPGEYRELLYVGINRIFQGFLYKFILAVLIKVYWLDKVVLPPWQVASFFSYMYAYGLYLFFDFAGYSAFAIGVSNILAIKTPENFNRPFLSANIKEFWNRWHMSLSYWFRDYVYMRLVMALTRKKRLRSKFAISSVGYLSLFGLMGVWHGLERHYFAYGLYHAALMIGYDAWEKLNKEKKLWGPGPYTRVISIILTFHFVCFGFVIFSGVLN